jgi:hypothetical protein
MTIEQLDTVVLDRDVPEFALHKGDLGTVVHIYEHDGLEAEFVTASGRTHALVTLTLGSSCGLRMRRRGCMCGSQSAWCDAESWPPGFALKLFARRRFLQLHPHQLH